jgi:omega-amidase
MLKIALIQTTLAWEQPEENLRTMEQQLLPLAGNSDLIVLPEMFNSGFTMRPEAVAEPMDGPTMQWMRRMAVATGAVVTGSLVIERDQHYHNRLVWMRPDGDYQHYDKKHLFRLAGEDGHYTAGQSRSVFEWKGWRIFPLICYDLRFPVWSRRTEHFDYDLLLYVANWPERRRQAWLRLLPARAIENQCYVAAVNRIGADGNGIMHSGDSMVLDFTGETVASDADKAGPLVHSLDLERLRSFRADFPFWQDADGFGFL